MRVRTWRRAGIENAYHARVAERKVWIFSWLNLSTALFMLAGLSLLLYPSAAAWVTQYNQSNVVWDQTKANSNIAKEEIDRAFADAHEYNEALNSGAILASGANVAEGSGATTSKLDYWSLLGGTPTGVMARLRISSINLDLPVYHGTSDATLLKGVGHLEGTSLPVGGKGTRSVLTGHRGLANATMFTNLDRVKKGDVISVEVYGTVFSYKVDTIEVVAPDATEEIRPDPERDLITLVTCTPLGINTHRILITGERILPTPGGETDAMHKKSNLPAFPWWIVIFLSGFTIISFWYRHVSRIPASKAAARKKRKETRRQNKKAARLKKKGGSVREHGEGGGRSAGADGDPSESGGDPPGAGENPSEAGGELPDSGRDASGPESEPGNEDGSESPGPGKHSAS